jgi:hypothetical protein
MISILFLSVSLITGGVYALLASITPNRFTFSWNIMQSCAIKLCVVLIFAIFALGVVVSIWHFLMFIQDTSIEIVINATLSNDIQKSL